MEEMDINVFRQMLIDYFKLTNETIDSITPKLDYRFETRRRVSFRVTDEHRRDKLFKALSNKKDLYTYYKSLCGTIESKPSSRYIIYPKDEEQTVINYIGKF